MKFVGPWWISTRLWFNDFDVLQHVWWHFWYLYL